MKYSANEFTALATKAARGAGAPPAQAVDFGRAALRHMALGRGACDLVDALDVMPEGPIMGLPLAVLQLMERAQDGVAQGTLETGHNTALAQSYVETLAFENSIEKRGLALDVTINTANPNLIKGDKRIDAPNALIQSLKTFAALILVPESDASRQAGAGAGLSDND